MTQARTIAEVIAGEMGYASKQATFADALGIASVMMNRSIATGVPVDQIARDAAAFNAYGKALPPGVGPQQIAMAAKALEHVQQNGPLITAKYYATPKAAKNLPKNLKQVEATTAHQFYDDPQHRPISVQNKTYAIQPNAMERIQSMVQQAVQKPPRPSRAFHRPPRRWQGKRST